MVGSAEPRDPTGKCSDFLTWIYGHLTLLQSIMLHHHCHTDESVEQQNHSRQHNNAQCTTEFIMSRPRRQTFHGVEADILAVCRGAEILTLSRGQVLVFTTCDICQGPPPSETCWTTKNVSSDYM